MRDIRFSIRTLSKSPGFTLVSVLTMALGIGALSSIFSVVNAVILRSLPYEKPSRLVLVEGYKDKDEERLSISYPDFLDWTRRQHSFQTLAARTETRSLILRTDKGPELLHGEIVSSSYFRLLGVKASLGRLFVPEEDVPPGTLRVALISDDFWHSHFAAERSAVGKHIDLDDVSYQIVGVLPPGFEGLTDEAKVFLPLSMGATLGQDYVQSRGTHWLYTVGRLKDGVTLEQARRDMDAITRQLAAESPSTNRDMRSKVTPLAEAWFGELQKKLYTLLASGFFLLLIVCTNLANLLLARFVARRRDLSLRMALGARRSGLVRQLLTESVILALLGCGTGLLVARWSTGLLVRASGIQLKSFVNVNIDLVVVAVILAVSLAAGFLFGLVPALVLSSKLRLYEIFNEGGRRGMHGEAHHRFQNTLIIGEVALALLLLVCAGLMTKGLQHLTNTKLGFKEQKVLTLRMSTRTQQLREDPAVWSLVVDAERKIGSLSGVESVAFEGPGVPTDEWSGSNVSGRNVSVEDRPAEEEPPLVALHCVSPGYFHTLGVPVNGRGFLSTDTANAQLVAVVNESMAKAYWPNQSPIGKRLMLGRRNPEKPKPWWTVVGVAADIRHGGLTTENRPSYNVYLPLLQQVPRLPSLLALLVRTSVPPESLASAVQEELHAVAPDLPVYDVATLDERLARQTAGNRAFVLLMSLFAFFALALAAVGVYGVVSYSVANRTQEIGVRMALGAQLRDVLRLVVGQGGRLALMGVALGLLLALVVTPVLTGWLYGVSPLDKVILVGMSILLLGVAMVASYIPARRAAKVAPFQALRLD
jgi:putative ABC transport system permease protein